MKTILNLVGTSELQKSKEIRIPTEAVEQLGWEHKDILVVFVDEKKKALVVKRIKEVVK